MGRKSILIIIIASLGLISLVFLGGSNRLLDTQELQDNDSQNLFLGPEKTFPLESPDFLLIQENSLKASLPPTTFSPQVLGALVGYGSLPETRKEILEYIVEEDDNPSLISQKFDIFLESLLWANDLNKNSIIRPGQKLVIPPVSGVIYHVKAGDTISEITKTYKGKVEEIIAFNELPSEGDIFIGDILVIPNGVMPPPPAVPSPTYVPLAQSLFICPIPLSSNGKCWITQRLHWYNAVDFSNGKCGEPIYAAAGGKVLKVKYGYNKGAGNYVRILHFNGVVTHYGHLSKALVTPDQPVSQGDIIGLMGYSGYTIPSGPAGCHLHFDVLNVPRGTNPFLK